MKRVLLDGSKQVKLEAEYYESPKPNSPVALILHGDQSRGGNMNADLEHIMFLTFIKHGFSALKFNFDAIESKNDSSENKRNESKREIIDASLAIDWIYLQNQNYCGLVVAGIDFSSIIGFDLVMRRPDVEFFVAVSPNNFDKKKFNDGLLFLCQSTGIIIHGSNDQYTKTSSVTDLYNTLTNHKKHNISYVEINGADNRFTNKMPQFIKVLDKYVTYLKTIMVKKENRYVSRKRKRIAPIE